MARPTVGDLVDRVQSRVNVGYPDSVVVQAIDELYKQACAKPLKWNLTTYDLQVAKGSKEVSGSLPSQFDPLMPCYLSGDPALNYAVEIPYRPVGQVFRHQAYGATGAIVGQYSVWTFRSGGPGVYTAVLYPFAAGGSHTLTLAYHQRPTDLTGASVLPWPDNLDPLMIDLIEAELLRRLRASGWEVAQKKAQDLLAVMIDKGLTTKEVMAGLVDGQRAAAELQTQGRSR